MRGKRWRLVFRKLTGADGLCDRPDTPQKAITIDPRVKRSSQRYAEVVLHELLHAAAWDLDEEIVSEYASDAARILHKLGFRYDKDASL